MRCKTREINFSQNLLPKHKSGEKQEQQEKSQQLIAQVPQVLDAQRAQQAGLNTIQKAAQPVQTTENCKRLCHGWGKVR